MFNSSLPLNQYDDDDDEDDQNPISEEQEQEQDIWIGGGFKKEQKNQVV